jgi:hypothetical protein
MKYKIYDFTKDVYFPRTKNIFIPYTDAVLECIDALDDNDQVTRLSVYIYSYENGAEEHSPKEIMSFEEFLGYAAKAKNDWLNWSN